MWAPIVEIDYPALAKHIVQFAWSGWSPVEGADENVSEALTAPTPGVSPLHAFEVIKTNLSERVQCFMDYEYPLSGKDEEMLSVLMKHHTQGEITDITISARPGIVVRLDEGMLILPLILIKLER